MRRSRNPQVFLPPLARDAIVSVEIYDDKPRAGDERNRTRDKDDRKEKKREGRSNDVGRRAPGPGPGLARPTTSPERRQKK